MAANLRWNIFARELEDILAVRNVALGVIDDRTSIHREKVRRLQHSLDEAKHFPTLSPNDLELVIQAFALTRDEVLRLRTAILATAIEKMLMDRISAAEALRAAEHIYAIVLAALRSEPDDLHGVRGDDKAGIFMDDMDDPDAQLDVAVEYIDWATLALHLSRSVTAQEERIERAREASMGFEEALRALREQSLAVRQTTAWRDWYAEAERGLATAAADRDDLGAR
ncbi:MAG TPA: hypothetical protein VKT52_04745 [Ktedonobacterales bacterium]|nr:hypothetical protein [Ktedonobacterales bacterium]